MHHRNYPARTKHDLVATVLNGSLSAREAAVQYGVSRRTVERWLKDFRTDGFDGLVPGRRGDRLKPRGTNAEWQALTQAVALSRPAYTIAGIHRWISERAERRGLTVPGYYAIYRWYHQIDPALRTMATHGTQHYQHQHELVHRWESEEPNALWQADHTLLDILVQDERGDPVRPWLTLVEDDFSRAVCGYVLSTDHPNALQTALALRHAICPKSDTGWPVCGLPGRLYTDRGRDFVSDHLEEICLRLHIQVIRSRPRQPRGKGKVERLFHTLNQGLLRALPGYTKTPAGDRSNEPLLTMAQLDGRLADFITGYYHQRPHGTTGEGPLARWTQGGFLPQLPADWALLDELLLTISKPRKVQRDGIQFRGFRYLSTTLAAYVGESVTIRYDPRDLAEIRVYYREAFLCRALCQAITGQIISLKEVESARRKVRVARKARLQQAREHLKTVKAWPVDNTEAPLFPAPEPPQPLHPIAVDECSSTVVLKLYRHGHRR